MSVFGRNIQALRHYAGLSQEAFAQIVGVSRGAVVKWETGETTQLRRYNIQRIRRCFGVTYDELVSDRLGLASQAALDLRYPSAADGLPLKTVAGRSVVASCPYCFIEVPLPLQRTYPQSFVLRLRMRDVVALPEGDSMRLPMSFELDKGDPGLWAHAIVDPYVKPSQGSSVIVRTPRRGVQALCLSTEQLDTLHWGTTKPRYRIVEANGESADVLGTIIWWQAVAAMND